MPASALMNIMTSAARKASRRLIRDFNEVEQLQVSVKGPSDFVSQADLACEKTLYEELSKAREGYGFLMEEQGTKQGADKTHRWIIDPLDGTTNFLHGIPLFAISIALEREGELVASLVYNPAMDECFTAEKGKGAFLNDRRIRIAGRKKMEDIVTVTGVPHRGKSGHDQFLREQKAVMQLCSGVRRTGSAALDLAWTAAGRFDAYWERGIQAWDMAGGILLVREAGGMVTDLDGQDHMLEKGHLLAANIPIHKAMINVISKASQGL